jgi:hypothetical protein
VRGMRLPGISPVRGDSRQALMPNGLQTRPSTEGQQCDAGDNPSVGEEKANPPRPPARVVQSVGLRSPARAHVGAPGSTFQSPEYPP